MHKPIQDDTDLNPKKRTICRCHVELYHTIKDLNIDEETKQRLLDVTEEAYGYGIKMNDKLREYAGKTWHKDVFND